MAIYNRIFSKEKWEKVNSYNKNLLNDYINQIKAEGKSPDSVKQYFNDGRIILIYILEVLENKPLYELNRKNFRNFTLYMQDHNMSPARINRLLCTSRNILNFGLDDDEFSDDFEKCKANPSRVKGVQKEKVREIVFLTDEEVHIIVEGLIKRELYQKAFLCAFAYDSASRRKEIYQVKRNDIDLDSIICKTKVRGKRGKIYKPMYNELTKRAFKLYMSSRDDNSNELWITKDKDGNVRKASYESLYVWGISARSVLREDAGIDKPFNLHSFRHSCAENLKKGTHYLCKITGKKFELSEIQKLMNHSDISTTQSYLANTDEEDLINMFTKKED
ncbi:site-specific tyrosine recombinase XerD [Clostridium sardiniense]